jgi:hypothetical protein
VCPLPPAVNLQCQAGVPTRRETNELNAFIRENVERKRERERERKRERERERERERDEEEVPNRRRVFVKEPSYWFYCL